MTREEIRARFIRIVNWKIGKRSSKENAEIFARKTLIKELMEKGFKNHDAVFEIHKAMENPSRR